MAEDYPAAGPVINEDLEVDSFTPEDEIYQNAIDEIYRQAEAGEGDLTKRILRPVYDAAAAATLDYNPEFNNYPEDKVADVVLSLMQRLQRDGELSSGDLIHLTRIGSNSRERRSTLPWKVINYQDEAGHNFMIDPKVHYVGLSHLHPVSFRDTRVIDESRTHKDAMNRIHHQHS